MELQFPLNYFTFLLSPRRSFLGRRALSWGQRVFVVFFLLATLLIPTSLDLLQQDSVDLSHYTPKALTVLSDDRIISLNSPDQGEVLLLSEGQVETVTSRETARDRLGGEPGFILDDQGFLIQEAGDLPVIEVPYSEDSTLFESQTVQDFTYELGRQWLQVQGLPIQLNQLLHLSLAMFMNLGLFLGGATIFIRLMDLNPAFTIDGWGGAFGLVLNLLSLPTLLVSGAGVLGLGSATTLPLQGLGFILMMAASFWTTHFNDTYALENIQEGRSS